jgi:hypothetical protein
MFFRVDKAPVYGRDGLDEVVLVLGRLDEVVLVLGRQDFE